MKEIQETRKNETALGKTPFRVSLNADGVKKYTGDPHSIEAFCGGQEDLANHILGMTSSVLGGHKSGVEGAVDAINITFQSMFDQKPRDSAEARLVTQAVSLYDSAMHYLEKASRATTTQYEAQCLNFATKLFRLHNETVEALSRYRRGGEQKVIVQHVNISEGGQAIVGSVLHGGGGNRNQGEVNP